MRTALLLSIAAGGRLVGGTESDEGGERRGQAGQRCHPARCSLDGYTAALELCQVVVRRQPLSTLWSSATGELVREAAPRVMATGGAPELMVEEMLHPLWTTAGLPPAETQGGGSSGRMESDEECKEDWLYHSAKQNGCCKHTSNLQLHVIRRVSFVF